MLESLDKRRLTMLDWYITDGAVHWKSFEGALTSKFVLKIGDTLEVFCDHRVTRAIGTVNLTSMALQFAGENFTLHLVI